MNHHKNIVRIKAVASAIKSLNKKIVFVGGATISLYADRPVFEVRPTDDVDVLIEILSYSERSELEEELRSKGFSHDHESGIVCRYKIQGIIVDIIPTNDSSIGFSNIWYPEGFKKSIDHAIDENYYVKILTAPYFIATKLEAHKDRGDGDGRTSEDFEDIVYVLENRKAIWDEMTNSDKDLKEYLVSKFKELLNNPNINEWIDSHVERGNTPATDFIIEKLTRFCE